MNRHIEKVYGKSAVQILKELNISLEPPIDLDQLLKSLGIYVREHDFSKIEKTSNLEKVYIPVERHASSSGTARHSA